MKIIKCTLIAFISLFFLNSCSKGDDGQNCPDNETIRMKINGQLLTFQISGWGIDLDNDGSGHTLFLQLTRGTYSPQQNTTDITLKLPYKKTGTNVMEDFIYFRVNDLQAGSVNFIPGDFQSKVTVNKNTCFSATFSGRAVLDGNEIVITEGVVDHVYEDPFD